MKMVVPPKQYQNRARYLLPCFVKIFRRWFNKVRCDEIFPLKRPPTRSSTCVAILKLTSRTRRSHMRQDLRLGTTKHFPRTSRPRRVKYCIPDPNFCTPNVKTDSMARARQDPR